VKYALWASYGNPTAKDTSIVAGQAVEVVNVDGIFLVLKQQRKKLNSPEYRIVY
jgi:membrane protein implicated in regulation of membrane protease activity